MYSVTSTTLIVGRLKMSRSIGIALIVLLLTARAAAENRMSGYLTQIDTFSVCIRARFRP